MRREGGGAEMTTLPRDTVWAVLRWLPWREQLRVRRVCRTWCSVVHERLTTAPRSWPKEALPALLRCNLRALETFSVGWDEVSAPLPTTLRRLSWHTNQPIALELSDEFLTPLTPTLSLLEAQSSALSRLVQLEDLTLDCLDDAAVRALSSLHALTRLQVSYVRSCSAESATLAAASWTRLCSLSVDETHGGLVEAMLLRGPTCLTHLTFFSKPSANVVEALQRTPLQLQSLSMLLLLPMPLEQWHNLHELNVGMCGSRAAARELLHRLVGCTSLRKLSIEWPYDASVVPTFGDLTMLRELELRMGPRTRDDTVTSQLPRLAQLTTLTLHRASIAFGHLDALAAVGALHTLNLFECKFDGLKGQLAALTQLRRLTLEPCCDLNVTLLPVGLESLICRRVKDPESLSRLTLLRRLELRQCTVGDAVLSWGSLTQLEEVVLDNVKLLPSTLLFDLEATLPALGRVEMARNAGVEPLPLTSRVVVEDY